MTVFVLAANAQGPPPLGGMGGGMSRGMGRGRGGPPGDMDPALWPPSRGGPRGNNSPPPNLSGKWWTNPAIVRRLDLSSDQQRRIDRIFQQTRVRLIDLQASLERQEALLDPLLAEDRPQEAPIVAQIDKVAVSRAELEKANARMLFAFRLVLTSEQWRELQSLEFSPNFRHK